MGQEQIGKVSAMEGMAKDMVNPSITIPVEKTISKLNNGKFSIEDYAIAFVYGMGKSQRERFKKMLEQNIKCGESIAVSYGVDYDKLIHEVKRILKVEE